jgi:hypothetical protein
MARTASVRLADGGSTSLVANGALVNRPRDDHGAPPHRGRRIATAVAFIPKCESQTGYSLLSDDLAASSR